MSIQGLVDTHFQNLLKKVRNKRYRLHNDEDPLFRILISQWHD